MTYTIDRFEAEYAICENRETREIVDIPIANIPIDAKEGDILLFSEGVYRIDHKETKIARSEIQELMAKLRRNDFGQ